MRRNQIHTGDLLAWSDFRNGKSDPGVALGPVPAVNLNGGRYQKAERSSQLYVVLTPTRASSGGMAVVRGLNERVESGEDGIPRDVAEFVAATYDRFVEGEIIDATGAPEHWGWRGVPGTMLRGAYTEFHACDVAKMRQAAEDLNRKREQLATNRAALAAARERLTARGLEADKVSFFREYNLGAESDSRVVLPLSMFQMLLDDGEQ